MLTKEYAKLMATEFVDDLWEGAHKKGFEEGYLQGEFVGRTEEHQRIKAILEKQGYQNLLEGE